MAQKRRGGFKPPANYDPNRKPKRAGTAAGGAPGRRGAASPKRAEPESPSGERADLVHRKKPSAAQRAAAPSRLMTPAPERLVAKRTTSADVAGLAFTDLGLGGNLVRVLGELGADKPFPIQAATIPDAIEGLDVLGRARTGSGKTIAFGAALVERLLRLKAQGAFASDPKPVRGKQQRGVRDVKRATRKPKALILAPTRELALQIDRTVQPLARSVGFYTAQFVGGVPVDPQVHALERGVDIIIGTPGRVQDLVTRRKLDLREVLVSIIDEADHMCDLGFLEPVQQVLRQTTRGGQRLLFSATLDASVSAIVAEFLDNPAVHEAEEAAAMPVDHRVFVVGREQKDEVLTELASTRGRVMIFCRTRAYAEQTAEMLATAGLKVNALHGNLSQARRELNLAKFTSGKSGVLVATDVAARGLHIDDVDLVVQADPPEDFKTYLHRSGRTGRAGKGGRVVLLTPRNRQTRTREMLDEAGIAPAFFGEVEPGFEKRFRGAKRG
ncbi:DEAD/DEAH box helicase [Leucobacter sp. NPDC058333]|uniref:DEAD/DEAH box helicase n=1 Tax=Leucobacter sp. NPDC058333 TaxID=3346450 RepID=UPI00365BD632